MAAPLRVILQSAPDAFFPVGHMFMLPLWVALIIGRRHSAASAKGELLAVSTFCFGGIRHKNHRGAQCAKKHYRNDKSFDFHEGLLLVMAFTCRHACFNEREYGA